MQRAGVRTVEIRAGKEEGDAGSDARLRFASYELTFLPTPTHKYTHSAQGAGLGGCQVEDDCANLIMPNNQKLSSK